ncbi:MAG: hypothetical protein ACT4PE_12065 [Candidatus Eiseniibacteriota bacterium]
MRSLTDIAWGTALLWIAAAPAAAAPLGKEFTYQGRLEQSGTPMNGTAHLRFGLWDAATGGAQIGTTQMLSNVPVVDGRFTVQLDGAGQFGSTAWSGDARWLQIEVCNDPACATSTILSPRQSVTAAPYARHAAGPWVTNGTTLSYGGGNVGIGTTTPNTMLSLGSANANSKLLVWDGGPGTGLGFGVGPAQFRIHLDLPTNRFSFLNAPSGSEIFTITGAGNVGAGTSAPAAKLDVRGDVKLGPSGQYFAPSGQENLRILRGSINTNGGVVAGSGFTVGHVGVGWYTVYFSPAFASAPTVTVSGGGLTVAHLGTAPTTTKVDVYVTFQGNYTDWPFYFTAIGPR